MEQVYLAHKLSARTHTGILKNIEEAKRWYKWACDHYPQFSFQAMWILNCEVYNDADAEQRRIGMLRNKSHIERCSQLWLIGPSISSGMIEEAEYAGKLGLFVYNLTNEQLDPLTCIRFPPEDMPKWTGKSLTQLAAR